MKEIMKLGSILLLICVIAAALLGLTNEVTIGRILEQREAAAQEARQAVLPEADRFEALDASSSDGVVELFEGYKGDEIVGHVAKSMPSGFGGGIEVFTGVSADGTVTGVRVGSHAETPGLGANVTLASFYEQYTGMAAEMIGVAKSAPGEGEILAVTGATITSQAVTDGVNAAIEAIDALGQ
jgi:electron transport complex protein RnfG